MLIKKTALLTAAACAALSMSVAAMASADNAAGFVVGVQGGYGDTHWSDSDPTGSNDIKDTGFAARGYVGFDINQYLGLEAGYTYLPKTTFSDAGMKVGGVDIKNYAIDLLAKLSVPITPVFKLYAKAGGSYFHSKFDAPTGTFTGTGVSDSESHVGPAFGVGAAYEVVPNLAIDLSWMRFSGGNKASFTNNGFTGGYQPNPDVVLLGVSYKFPVSYS